MSKKWLFIISGIVVVGIIIYIIFFKNSEEPLISFETYGSDSNTISNTGSVDDLEDGCFYVWHNNNAKSIEEDLNGAASMDVFKLCPKGERNWEKDNDRINHVLWFTSANDIDIPTLYDGDELLFVSSTEVPFEGIEWERYADYGYSIGVANLISDESDHYHIERDDKKGFQAYIYEKSDSAELNEYKDIKNLFLDKVGNIAVRKSLVSDGGTVMNLEKNASYVCEWYTGTFYQDYEMVANIHPFCALETFTTHEYDFLHSSCISITIPEWFKSGYYYVNGLGLFRYVTNADARTYNGEPYDSSVEWNERIIIKNERGETLYDPSRNYKNTVYSESTNDTTNSNYYNGGTATINDTTVQNQGNSGYEPSEVGDVRVVIPNQ